MIHDHAILWMFAWLFLVSWLLGCILAGLLSFMPLAKNLGLQRSQIIWTCALPLILPLAVSSGMIIPSIAKAMNWIEDHCLIHFQHHPHFCFEHLPEFLVSVSQSTFTYSGLALVSILFFSCVVRLLSNRTPRIIQRLLNKPRPLLIVNSKQEFAFTAGITKPFIAFSTALKYQLSKHEQRMVVAHEAAHIRNKDILKNTLFELMLSFNLCKKRLRAAWYINTESRADAEVVQRFDPLTFASLLLRLKQRELSRVNATSIAGASFEARIRHLLAPQKNIKSAKYHGLFLCIVALLITILSIHHHTIESIIGWWLSVLP